VLVGETDEQSASLAGGSQSVRSSDETGNDRGAKGRRKVEVSKDRQTEEKTNASAREG
jgi:hypothetical protein